MEKTKDVTIILVHGAWADGSQWRKVIPAIQKAGYLVRSVQLSLSSVEDDVAKTVDMIEAAESKVLLVGHSYGGVVITSAGNHQKVLGMVYLAAFAPDEGESLGMLLAKKQSYGAENIYPDQNGFLWLKEEKFHSSLCKDLEVEKALILAACQRPLHSICTTSEMSNPAWRNKKCWYQISNADQILPAETQKEMTERMSPEEILDLHTGHLSMLSKPQQTSSFILKAASSL
ncbi:alpha/beta hydrolase [Chryseobacterium balustinum]|uniref:alpha/beta hydrolase n=1 Tax=Chryseobacterium balustinum TaxID=246 RepID=UPI003CE82245